ncbi:hypothetical protein [Alicyclobacillus fodiniaquatilis]|uniref:Nickel/cobalt efflux system n=1 Tax=Alicyclobacillus fodiniaquatilis TaxID=1661150 RepID=A0ABW4JJF6_9BACL
MSQTTLIGLAMLAVVLGFRHGIDWDHIAAITDLVGGETDKRRGFMLALWYAIGHEVVIVVFGALAVLLGWTLPHWVDGMMERFVGVTLLILAVFFIISLIRNRQEFVFVSRWRLLLISFYSIFAWVDARFGNRYRKQTAAKPQIRVTFAGAFSIGIVHGVGAETPTQLLLFATASGLASPVKGFSVVMLFVLGLLCSHLMITCVSLAGFMSALRHRLLVRTVGIATATYSLLMGVIFTMGYAGWLPTLL